MVGVGSEGEGHAWHALMAMALDWNVGHTMKKDKTEAEEDSSSINIIISSMIFRSGNCCCCVIL